LEERAVNLKVKILNIEAVGASFTLNENTHRSTPHLFKADASFQKLCQKQDFGGLSKMKMFSPCFWVCLTRFLVLWSWGFYWCTKKLEIRLLKDPLV